MTVSPGMVVHRQLASPVTPGGPALRTAVQATECLVLSCSLAQTVWDDSSFLPCLCPSELASLVAAEPLGA